MVALLFDGGRHVIGQFFGGVRRQARGVLEETVGDEADLLNEDERLFEVRVRLAGATDDPVGTELDLGHDLAQHRESFAVAVFGVTALHRAEQVVR